MKIKDNIKKSLPLLLALSIGLNLGSYSNNIIASNTLQSTGKLVYTNPETGEEVIIDTADLKVLQEDINTKVDKVEGKVLSSNDYTTAEKNKLAGIAAEANKTIVDSALSTTSTNPVQNKVITKEINKIKAGLETWEFSDVTLNNLNPTGEDFGIACSTLFTVFVFNGVKLKTAVAANGYSQLATTFEGWDDSLNGIVIPIMVLNSYNIPIGSAQVIVYNGTLLLHTNVNISTTDRLYGNLSRWHVK